MIATRLTEADARRAAEAMAYEPWEYTVVELGTLEQLEKQRRKEREGHKPLRTHSEPFPYPPDLDLRVKKDK